MQSVTIQGFDQIVRALDATQDAIRKARAEVFEEGGRELLAAVRQRIGGRGNVARMQDYFVGSGRGYVAVRAKRNETQGGYAAGYITNALENGHRPGYRQKQRVGGKYMYRDTYHAQAQRMAENGARRIETAAMKALQEGSG